MSTPKTSQAYEDFLAYKESGLIPADVEWGVNPEPVLETDHVQGEVFVAPKTPEEAKAFFGAAGTYVVVPKTFPTWTDADLEAAIRRAEAAIQGIHLDGPPYRLSGPPGRSRNGLTKKQRRWVGKAVRRHRKVCYQCNQGRGQEAPTEQDLGYVLGTS